MGIDDTFDHLKYNIVKDKYGNIFYYNKDEQLHKENDQQAIIWANGSRAWWVNGVRIK
jgi:superfamily I DNA/RNA helicase